MFENLTEKEARSQILESVAEYYEKYHSQKKEFFPGDHIGYAGRVYDQEELQNGVDSVLEFWLTAGRYTQELENALKQYLDTSFVGLTNSGSSANLLAFMALTSHLLPPDRRVCPGDEVITVAAGFPTTVTPILQFGAIPVFVDVDIPTYDIDVMQLDEALSPKTKAVFVAHTLGNPFDLAAVKAFCDAHDLWLVEDNCDALGAEFTIEGVTKKTGTWGDIGTSSFYPAHHMTMGEGGAVYTDDPILYRAMMSFRDWGRDCVCRGGQDNSCGHRFDGQYGQLPWGYDHKYVYSHLGYNLKITDIQAAIGAAQIKKVPDFVQKRREHWNTLHKGLKPVEDRIILPEITQGADPSWFGFIMTVRPDSGLKAAKIANYIEGRGIQTRRLFSGNIIKHPCFDEIRGSEAYRVVGDLTNTDYIMENSLWVGVYPGLTEPMLEYMIATIIDATGGKAY